MRQHRPKPPSHRPRRDRVGAGRESEPLSNSELQEHIARSGQESREVVDLILAGQLQEARAMAARRASEIRTGQGDATPETETLGELWQVAEAMGVAQSAMGAEDFDTARDSAHHAAEAARRLRERGAIAAEHAQRIIQAAGGRWTQANNARQQSGDEQQSGRGRYGVFTTGRATPGAGVTSTELSRSGSWQPGDFLTHHSDRSTSWAAENIRNTTNQDLQAYDFTFEKTDANGVPIAGTAHGLPLITPSDMKVLDIQSSFQGSGGYGKFITLEDVQTGLRIQVNHLDTVGEFSKGQILSGGTTFGTQGGSGNARHSFATHVDIVGTEEAVEQFVRSNQSGTFKTRTEQPR